MKSSDHFLLVTGQWFASSLSMLASRNTFEIYRGLGSREKEAGFASTSFQLGKKKKRERDKRRTQMSQRKPWADAHSRHLLTARSGQKMKQVVEQQRLPAATAGECTGSEAKKDIKWNIKAADTKQTPPGNRDSTHHHTCLGAGLY